MLLTDNKAHRKTEDLRRLLRDCCRHGLRESYAHLIVNRNSRFDANFHASARA